MKEKILRYRELGRLIREQNKEHRDIEKELIRYVQEIGSFVIEVDGIHLCVTINQSRYSFDIFDLDIREVIIK